MLGTTNAAASAAPAASFWSANRTSLSSANDLWIVTAAFQAIRYDSETPTRIEIWCAALAMHAL
jgi:hypothetical protein